MNKYQEAFEDLCITWDEEGMGKDHFKDQYPYLYNTIKELVDKETPMKVIIQERVLDTDYYCPKCNGELLYGEEKYCDMCGQRLYLEESENNVKD